MRWLIIFAFKAVGIGVGVGLILVALASCSSDIEVPLPEPVAGNYSTMLERQREWEQQWVDALNELVVLKQEYERRLAEPPPPTKFIEIPVEKIFIVNEEIPVKLADWSSVDELKLFLEADDTDTKVSLKADNSGNVSLEGYCEDRAIQLMDRAAAEGKRLSFVPLHPVEYLKWYGEERGEFQYHAICGALVGTNQFYYIEPSDDRVWLAQYLD